MLVASAASGDKLVAKDPIAMHMQLAIAFPIIVRKTGPNARVVITTHDRVYPAELLQNDVRDQYAGEGQVDVCAVSQLQSSKDLMDILIKHHATQGNHTLILQYDVDSPDSHATLSTFLCFDIQNAAMRFGRAAPWVKTVCLLCHIRRGSRSKFRALFRPRWKEAHVEILVPTVLERKLLLPWTHPREVEMEGSYVVLGEDSGVEADRAIVAEGEGANSTSPTRDGEDQTASLCDGASINELSKALMRLESIVHASDQNGDSPVTQRITRLTSCLTASSGMGYLAWNMILKRVKTLLREAEELAGAIGGSWIASVSRDMGLLAAHGTLHHAAKQYQENLMTSALAQVLACLESGANLDLFVASTPHPQTLVARLWLGLLEDVVQISYVRRRPGEIIPVQPVMAGGEALQCSFPFSHTIVQLLDSLRVEALLLAQQSGQPLPCCLLALAQQTPLQSAFAGVSSTATATAAPATAVASVSGVKAVLRAAQPRRKNMAKDVAAGIVQGDHTSKGPTMHVNAAAVPPAESANPAGQGLLRLFLDDLLQLIYQPHSIEHHDLEFNCARRIIQCMSSQQSNNDSGLDLLSEICKYVAATWAAEEELALVGSCSRMSMTSVMERWLANTDDKFTAESYRRLVWAFYLVFEESIPPQSAAAVPLWINRVVQLEGLIGTLLLQHITQDEDDAAMNGDDDDIADSLIVCTRSCWRAVVLVKRLICCVSDRSRNAIPDPGTWRICRDLYKRALDQPASAIFDAVQHVTGELLDAYSVRLGYPHGFTCSLEALDECDPSRCHQCQACKRVACRACLNANIAAGRGCYCTRPFPSDPPEVQVATALEEYNGYRRPALNFTVDVLWLLFSDAHFQATCSNEDAMGVLRGIMGKLRWVDATDEELMADVKMKSSLMSLLVTVSSDPTHPRHEPTRVLTDEFVCSNWCDIALTALYVETVEDHLLVAQASATREEAIDQLLQNPTFQDLQPHVLPATETKAIQHVIGARLVINLAATLLMEMLRADHPGPNMAECHVLEVAESLCEGDMQWARQCRLLLLKTVARSPVGGIACLPDIAQAASNWAGLSWIQDEADLLDKGRAVADIAALIVPPEPYAAACQAVRATLRAPATTLRANGVQPCTLLLALYREMNEADKSTAASKASIMEHARKLEMTAASIQLLHVIQEGGLMAQTPHQAPGAAETPDRVDQVVASAAFQMATCISCSSSPLASPLKALLVLPEEMMESYWPGTEDDVRAEVMRAAQTAGDVGVTSYYSCPNGHFYGIGNCGQAMVTAKCPQCGTPIGGTSHNLVAGNRTVEIPTDETAQGYAMLEDVVAAVPIRSLGSVGAAALRFTLHVLLACAAVAEAAAGGANASGGVRRVMGEAVVGNMGVREVLRRRIREDFEGLANNLELSAEDTALALSHISKGLLSGGSDAVDHTWRDKPARNRWEASWEDNFVRPLVENLGDILHDTRGKVAAGPERMLVHRINETDLGEFHIPSASAPPADVEGQRGVEMRSTDEDGNAAAGVPLASAPIFTPDEEVSASWGRALFRYRTHITWEGFEAHLQRVGVQQDPDGENGSGNLAGLRAFVAGGKVLSAVQHLPAITRLQKRLIHEFNGRDPTDLDGLTAVSYVESLKHNQDSVAADIAAFSEAWDLVSDRLVQLLPAGHISQSVKVRLEETLEDRLASFYAKHNPSKVSDAERIAQHYDQDETSLNLRLKEAYGVVLPPPLKTRLSFFLPSEVGDGVCSLALTMSLLQTHNEFVGVAMRTVEQTGRVVQTVTLDSVRSEHILSYSISQDVLPIIQHFTDASPQYGQGGAVSFRMEGIESSLMDKLVLRRSLPLIHIKSMAVSFGKQLLSVSTFEKLRELGQVALAPGVVDEIHSHLRRDGSLGRSVQLLENCLSIAASTSPPPDAFLHQFLKGVLHVDQSEGLWDCCSTRNIQMRNLLYLWQGLDGHLAKFISANGQDAFATVPPEYKTPLSQEQMKDLDQTFKALHIQGLLTELRELALLRCRHGATLNLGKPLVDYVQVCVMEKDAEITGVELLARDLRLEQIVEIWKWLVR